LIKAVTNEHLKEIISRDWGKAAVLMGLFDRFEVKTISLRFISDRQDQSARKILKMVAISDQQL
jgi:hypothetical protein